MLVRKALEELAHIARNGGGFIIDGTRFTADDLAHLARNMKPNGLIQIENADRFTADQLAHVSRNAVGTVVFA